MMTVKSTNRRDFLKKCSLSALPLLVPAASLQALPSSPEAKVNTNDQAVVNFIYDGFIFSPQEYLAKLNEINTQTPIQGDFYGDGGATTALEQQFAKLTGKEKAIYLPTGTMANQLAIKLLSGNSTKVIVPENSHIFRDEADAAQSVHHKRLVPVGKGKSYFELKDVKAAINYLNHNEVFKSGLTTIAIENPVRRADGQAMPLKVIQEISAYCKANGYKLHLDGARIHLAMAYHQVSLAEYASYFDTVYISLYKYLHAAGGAILCGDAVLIDQVKHQIKTHGGTVFQTWNNTSMALHYLQGIEARWKKLTELAEELIQELNKLEGLKIQKVTNGTNIYHLSLAESISLKQLANYLNEIHNIWLGRADEEGIVKFTINESLLSRSINDLIVAWKEGMKKAKK